MSYGSFVAQMRLYYFVIPVKIINLKLYKIDIRMFCKDSVKSFGIIVK